MIYKLMQRNKADWWVLTDYQWVKESHNHTLCKKCHKVLPHVYPRPVDVRLRQLPKKRTVDRTDRGGIGVMRRELHELLAGHMESFAFGRCLDLQGDVIDSHVSFYTNHHIVVRGGPKSKYEPCNECGSMFYLFEGRKPHPYVLRRYLTPGRHVYHDYFPATFVTRELADSITWALFKDIELFPVPERDTPLDGMVLPGDPPEWVTLSGSDAGSMSDT